MNRDFIQEIIKYTIPVTIMGNEKYALEIKYEKNDSELLEFDTQVEQMKKYEELCKQVGEQ